MIKAKTSRGTMVWVSFCDDVEPNKGGYFCQVYDTPDMEIDIDCFVIQAEDVLSKNKEAIATEYIKSITEY